LKSSRSSDRPTMFAPSFGFRTLQRRPRRQAVRAPFGSEANLTVLFLFDAGQCSPRGGGDS
jgi:hypothetical protein